MKIRVTTDVIIFLSADDLVINYPIFTEVYGITTLPEAI